ncbi:MAG: hypothetical protein HYX68_06900 [Planctomycetes bacterium]|nr:hypothetical protein [Planctomycetota bacterium]
MPRKGALVGLIGFFLCGSSGGGTMANLEGRPFFAAITVPSRPPIPFGAVGADVLVIGNAMTRPFGGDGTMIFATAALIDLPFSTVGDLVTFPWATYEFTREAFQPTGKYSFLAQVERPGPLEATSPTDDSRVGALGPPTKSVPGQSSAGGAIRKTP